MFERTFTFDFDKKIAEEVSKYKFLYKLLNSLELTVQFKRI